MAKGSDGWRRWERGRLALGMMVDIERNQVTAYIDGEPSCRTGLWLIVDVRLRGWKYLRLNFKAYRWVTDLAWRVDFETSGGRAA